MALAAAPFSRGAGRLFDVREYGARGDGKSKDTASLQKAVEACAHAGGGTVYLSPGTYLSGTVVLKDNVTFHLEAGATLLGSTDLADYTLQPGPPAKGDANGKHLLFARDAENVTLSGSGRIDGQGHAFWVPANARPAQTRRRSGATWRLTIGNRTTALLPWWSSSIAATCALRM